MPLDTAGLNEESAPAEAQVEPPTLQSGATLGEALRAVREHAGLSVEAVAELTRVRRAYLAAIEETRLDQLPSRPFTIGYIRAYAQALGLDGEAAVERFRAEEPVLDEPLRAPVGVGEERDPRLAALLVAGLLILAAIVTWNIVQRAMMAAAPEAGEAASEDLTQKALAQTRSGPVALGTPLPAPVESTTPELYETPGLAEAGPDGMGNHSSPASLADTPDAVLVDPATLPATFTPKGMVYSGGDQTPSVVTLQALRPAALIIRGPDGSVHFARQLAKGDAYRAPRIAGLTADVSEPQDFQVFVGGQSRGVLPATQVSISRLEG